MKTRRSVGTKGEALALEYLQRQGYEIVQTNFRFDRAEIDVIAREKDTLVFVEVKMRRGKSVGEPEDAITLRKRDQIRKAAEGYLYKSDLPDADCRFDVISIKQRGRETEIYHLKDVF
jgi:putative endonuclease